MNYNIIILLAFFLLSCTNTITHKSKKTFSTKGFAYVYDHKDFENKLINKKFKSDSLEVGHKFLSIGSLIKITNPQNNKSLITKNKKKVSYPDFYTILITKKIAEKLELDKDIPYIRLDAVKKNKSFVAKKAETFNEEKKIHNKAPIEHVKIDNISKKKTYIKKDIKKFSIFVGEFYSIDVVKLLKKRIIKESAELDRNKMKILVKGNNKIHLVLSPYKSIENMKKDYFELKKFGFEELEILLDE